MGANLPLHGRRVVWPGKRWDRWAGGGTWSGGGLRDGWWARFRQRNGLRCGSGLPGRIGVCWIGGNVAHHRALFLRDKGLGRRLSGTLEGYRLESHPEPG